MTLRPVNDKEIDFLIKVIDSCSDECLKIGAINFSEASVDLQDSIELYKFNNDGNAAVRSSFDGNLFIDKDNFPVFLIIYTDDELVPLEIELWKPDGSSILSKLEERKIIKKAEYDRILENLLPKADEKLYVKTQWLSKKKG